MPPKFKMPALLPFELVKMYLQTAWSWKKPKACSHALMPTPFMRLAFHGVFL